jgi:hypothetical protein
MDQLRAADVLGKDWVAAVLLLVIGMVAWVNMASPRQWTVLRRSFFSFRLGKQSLRDELTLQDRTLVGLLATSVVLIALFAYQVLVFKGWLPPGVTAFGRTLMVVAATIVARILLMRLLSVLADADGGTAEYLYTVVVFEVVLGLLLLPLCMLMAYPFHIGWRSWLWEVGLGVAVAVGLFRWARAVLVGIGNGVPFRYIFLYLCAAEILPVALAVEHAGRFVAGYPHTP